MNLPNCLTVFRIILTFFFIYFLQKPGFNAKYVATGIFAVASFTDWLDGFIARRYKLITDFGKIMDPIADKFLTLSAFVVFSLLGIIPFWMTLLIAVREIGLTLLRFKAMGEGKVLAAESLGKYKTVCQMLTIIVILYILILPPMPDTHDSINHQDLVISVLMWITLGITVISGISNISQNRRAYGF